ncbi:hypothetical protein MNBD_GAMMA12-3286 [hydrothermal vent metagenome]|uniref:Uncharacterized protein n=1 Tax=hydrothermal vent metagenome TaxID=652676 RepID=A0A3B0YK02_9ZZZZ
MKRIGYKVSVLLIIALIVVIWLEALNIVKFDMWYVTIPFAITAFSFYLASKLPVDFEILKKKRTK